MTGAAMAPVDSLLAERACERLIIDFVRRLDLGEPGSVADLFTADGVWEWPTGAAASRARRRCAPTSAPGLRTGCRVA